MPTRLFRANNPPQPVSVQPTGPCPPDVASDWLPLVRDLMAGGWSLQAAVDHLAELAVAAHRFEHADGADSLIQALPQPAALSLAGGEGGGA